MSQDTGPDMTETVTTRCDTCQADITFAGHAAAAGHAGRHEIRAAASARRLSGIIDAVRATR